MKATSKVKKFGREEVGISNLIATMVLIVAAIVGGAFVFITMRDQATTMASNPDASIQSINITETASNTVATATVKNSGSKPLTDVVVSTVQDDNIIPTGTVSSLAPGDTVGNSISSTGALAGTYTAGEEYIVTLHAETAGGDSIDKTLKVRVE